MHDTWIFLAVACCCLVILLSTCSAGAETQLIEVHGPDGQRYRINPMFVTTAREPIAQDRKYFHHGTHCVVFMVSGKFIATRETCDQVAKMLTR